MVDKNKKLNFDLEFLENVKTKPESENLEEPTIEHNKSEHISNPNKNKISGWWIAFIVLAAILLHVW